MRRRFYWLHVMTGSRRDYVWLKSDGTVHIGPCLDGERPMDLTGEQVKVARQALRKMGLRTAHKTFIYSGK